MCCGPLPGCLIHIKAPAIIYIMSLPAALPPLLLLRLLLPRPYVRVHVCLHAHARTGSQVHGCTDRQALTQTVTHNDAQRHKNSQSSHTRAGTKVWRTWRLWACAQSRTDTHRRAHGRTFSMITSPLTPLSAPVSYA